jgi:uncharacterized RDD family membrane protein YckC
MLLWIIEDGTTKGPFEDYVVREMIRDGEIHEDTRIWHEGAEGWLKAREIPALEGEFLLKEVVPPPIPIAMPPFLAWRRFGARTFDFFLYQLIFLTVLRIVGYPMIPDPSQEYSVWPIIGALVPAILMEAALISSIGCTPGKWFMSLRVENHLGKILPTSHALVRSMRVWVLGMGMMHPILIVLGHAITLWFGLKKGAPLWDLHSGFRVPGSEMKPGRQVAYWISLAVVLIMIGVVTWPEMEPLFQEEMRRQGK